MNTNTYFQQVNNELWPVSFEGTGNPVPFKVSAVTAGIHPKGYCYGIAESADGRQHDITREQASRLIGAGFTRTIGLETEFEKLGGVLQLK